MAEVVRDGTTRVRRVLTLALSAGLTAEGNLGLQEWLGDLAELAVDGAVDTWQEDFGDAFYVRVHAGGREEKVEGRFPH